MKWIAHINKPRKIDFEIVYDESVGYYLYVYDSNDIESKDELQDTLEIAMQVAKEDFNVPIDAWKISE